MDKVSYFRKTVNLHFLNNFKFDFKKFLFFWGIALRPEGGFEGDEGSWGGPGGSGVSSIWVGPGVYTVTIRVGGPRGYYQEWSDYGPWKENFGKWMDNFGGWMDRFMGGMGNWMDRMGDWMGDMGNWMGGMGNWMGTFMGGPFPFGHPMGRPGGFGEYRPNGVPTGGPNGGGGSGVEIFTGGPNNDNNPYLGYLPWRPNEWTVRLFNRKIYSSNNCGVKEIAHEDAEPN